MAEKKNVPVHLNIPPHVQPIHADEAHVNVAMKVNVDKEKGKEHITKTATVHVFFYDKTTNQVVSRVALDPITARDLGRILIGNSQNVLKEIHSNKVPKEVKEQLKAQEKARKDTKIIPGRQDYIG